MMNFPLFAGIAGMILILLAFILNQISIWKNDDIIYDAVNFVGSVALVYYAWIGEAWPFLILNTVWAFFSLRDVFLDYDDIRSGKKKFYWYHLSRNKRS
jgi:uncharacterized membrane protein YdcZ (DUF606 family)